MATYPTVENIDDRATITTVAETDAFALFRSNIAYKLALNDLFDSGQWEPALEGAGTAGSYTYSSANDGFWARCPNFAVVHGVLNIDAELVAASGGLSIINLPFVFDGGISRAGVCFGSIRGIELDGAQLMGRIVPGSDAIILERHLSTGFTASSLTSASISATQINVHFTATYAISW